MATQVSSDLGTGEQGASAFDHASRSTNALLAGEASDARAWVRNVRAHRESVPDDFNWLGFAEGAGANARHAVDAIRGPFGGFSAEQQLALRAALCAERWEAPYGDSEARVWFGQALQSLTWAQAALAAYDVLTRRATRGREHGYAESAMHLRASLIATLGAIPGDPVLDGDIPVYWFFDQLRLTPERALAKARACRQQMACREITPRLRANLRQLRRIKNRLTPLVLLSDSGQLEASPALRTWLELRAQLP